MQNESPQQKSNAALREEAILTFWKENDIFKKSLEKDAPKGNYVFYDGPPFATGQIHYGHILGSTAKDAIGRYQTMQGYHVPRRWGWDCHGLPIENIVEKELGIAGHKEIEAYGIEKFVEYARSKVLQYENDWETGVERIGRWVNFRGGYKTMDNTFIESVWWALSELNKKGLVYEGVRVLAYCPRCETPIANSEIAMDNSYKDITDISVYVKFELADEPGTYLLAWTTTPWTLPGNFALAVNPDFNYVKIKIGESFYILAKDRLAVVKEQYEIVAENLTIIGKSYKPLFDYFSDKEFANKENAWKVYGAKYVTNDAGTGIVHTAPAHGEEDMELAKLENIPFMHHVLNDGTFAEAARDFMGLPVKPRSTEKDGHQVTDIEIIKHLAHNNLLFAKEKIVHAYPHCMRCDTPIIYHALPSWFINIQKIKSDLIKNVASMHWIPEHLKDGRFKNILESAPDWTISRNRYWASPLPIWKSEDGKLLFVDSLQTLKEKTKKSGNKYFVMRHAESEHNLKGVWSTTADEEIDRLTETGKEQVAVSAKKFDTKVDFIITSPFRRGRDSAAIVAQALGLDPKNIIIDPRIGEWNVGNEYNGQLMDVYFALRNKSTDRYHFKTADGESYADVFMRIGNFLYDLESTYHGKNILIVTHGGTARAMEFVTKGFAYDTLFETSRDYRNFSNAEIRAVDFTPLPHNANFELDFHRPYIDQIVLLDEAGMEYKRIPEVIDCWFESGSMPFAQDHYPFERPNWHEENFPAGFVAEYIAQTRTWFYYTTVVSSILFNHAPFEHVVTTGTLLAEDGQKISKSKKNYPDPWIFIDKYGVDALRFYLMSGPLMKGEDTNFSEKMVADISSKLIGRLQNVVAFYELYRDTQLEGNYKESIHILDQWITARLNQTIAQVSRAMEQYDMAEAARPFDLFVDDLSTWHLRRSRDRIKDGDTDAKQTLYMVLKTLAQLMAPFTPFAAEDIWQRLKTENDVESVHLSIWPKSDEVDQDLLNNMQIIRNICTSGNALRKKQNIPIRQPLSLMKISYEELNSQLLDLIRDELNIKEILLDKEFEDTVWLDTTITPELKAEGNYRELVRAVQDLRKEKGLTPQDIIMLTISPEAEPFLTPFIDDFKKTVLATSVQFAENSGSELKIDEMTLRVTIEK